MMANKVLVGKMKGRHRTQKVVFEEVPEEKPVKVLPPFNPLQYVKVYRSLKGEEYKLPTWTLKSEAKDFQLTPPERVID